jgi:hypothetical protein
VPHPHSSDYRSRQFPERKRHRYHLFGPAQNDRDFSNNNLGANGAENNTVQNGAISNQTWDLERYDLIGSNLSIIGGFNFLTGKGSGSSAVFPMGDIFVYLGNETPYSVPSAGDHDGPWAGKDAWDYVIHFDRGTDLNIRETAGGIGYSIFQKSENHTINLTQSPAALQTGLPWYVTAVSTPEAFGALTTSIDGEGTHYTIGGIDISEILGANQPFYLHSTMRCGNDVLWGHNEGPSNVPDGGVTLCLLGSPIGALGLMRRRIA